MSKKSMTALAGAMLITFLPLASYAQSNNSSTNNAPLGSKDNPIKPSSVTSSPTNNNSSAKGKRGSKNNPITGSVHPRGSN